MLIGASSTSRCGFLTLLAPLLSPIQTLAVRYIAGGWSNHRTADELKIPVRAIEKWRKKDEEFRAALENAVANHVELVEAMLLEGEARAASTLVEALKAVDKLGQPRWSTRVDAAITLLDRAGARGRAVERQQVAVASVKSPVEVEGALRKALRDPGVREWLRETGALAAFNVEESRGGGGELRGDNGMLKELPLPLPVSAPQDVVVADAEVVPIQEPSTEVA